MTTIVAVKKGKRLCIASDSLSMFGSRKEIGGKHVYNDGKIIKLGQNYVGLAGHHSWNLILKHYFRKRGKIPEWKTIDQIFEICNTLHRELKEVYYLAPSYSRYEPLESSEFAMLIVNPYGIFEVDYLRTVRQHSQFTAIGTGEEYALGAIKALYDKCEDPEKLAKIGVEAAAQYDRKTGLPLAIYSTEIA